MLLWRESARQVDANHYIKTARIPEKYHCRYIIIEGEAGYQNNAKQYASN